MTEQQFIQENGYFMADLKAGVEISASIDYTPVKNPVWVVVHLETRRRIAKGSFAEVWGAYRAAMEV